MAHHARKVKIDQVHPEQPESSDESADLTDQDPAGNAEPAGASEAAEETVEEMRAALESERQRADDSHDRYLRTLAEFHNYRRRQEERETSFRQFATRELLLSLLAIVDDFERAVAAAEESRSFEALHEGLGLTLKKLVGLLEKEGVRPIVAVGQEFDPTLHEAVMRVEDESYEDNTVVDELQKGYLIGDDVLRPSRVTVAA